MNQRTTRFRWLTMILLASAASGCSNGRLPTFPVNGRVVFPNGSPVRTGTVEFRSRDHEVQARGEISQDGSFRLTTYQENDGAVAGFHDCVIVQMVIVEELQDHAPSTEGVVHPRFGSYATSGLQCEISPDGENSVSLQVDGFQSDAGGPKPPSDGGHDHDVHHHHDHAPHGGESTKGTRT